MVIVMWIMTVRYLECFQKIFKVPTDGSSQSVVARERRTHNKFLVTDDTVIIGQSYNCRSLDFPSTTIVVQARLIGRAITSAAIQASHWLCDRRTASDGRLFRKWRISLCATGTAITRMHSRRITNCVCAETTPVSVKQRKIQHHCTKNSTDR